MRYFFILILFISNLATAQQAEFPITENLGQWENAIDYRVHNVDHTIFIEKNGVWTIVLSDHEKYDILHDLEHHSDPTSDKHQHSDFTIDSNFHVDHFAYKVHFIGADFSNQTKGEASPFYFNYFIGNDPSKHKSFIRSYKHIYYKNVWNGIDLKVYTSKDHQFKYDFIVHPGADLKDIQLKYEGQECLTLEQNILTINGSFSLLQEEMPLTYIERNKETIPCTYVLRDNTISFEVDNIEINETIIIDPILIAATASGSTGKNYGYTSGFDNDGNIYSGAKALETGYPTTLGAYQQFMPLGDCMAINKYNPTGSTLMYSTYLGGKKGVSYPASLACTDSKKLVILGSSNSKFFPTTSSAIQPTHGGGYDFTISVLSEDGSSLIGSTYLGGSDDDGTTIENLYPIKFTKHDHLKGMVKIVNGEIICVGSISSPDIPGLVYPQSNSVSKNNPDAIVFKADTFLSTLNAHTIVGGSGPDRGYGLDIDDDDYVYICGTTGSLDFPTTTGVYQEQSLGDLNRSAGYVSKLSPNLDSILLSTYISTQYSNSNKGVSTYFVSLDQQNNIYVYGVDKSLLLPQIGTGYQFGDGLVYIAKFDPTLSTLIETNKMGSGYSSELGAFKVDHCNRILFSCFNNTSSFETTPNHIMNYGGIYIGILSSGGQNLTFGTYYTGNHVDGGTSQFSRNGTIYHAVCVSGNTFNCHANAYSQNITSEFDAKVFKIDPEIETIDIEISNAWPNMEFCKGSTYNFDTEIIGSLSNVSWYYDGQLVSHDESYNAIFQTLGTHVLKVVGESECVHLSEDSVVFEVFEIEPEFTSDSIQCIDGFVNFSDESFLPSNFSGNISDWHWDFGDGNTSNVQHPMHSYSSSGLYDVELIITTSNGCEYDILKELQVKIFDVDIDFTVDSVFCAGDEVEFIPTVIIPSDINAEAESYFWNFGDGNTSTDMEPVHIYTEDGQFDVLLQVTLDNGCQYQIKHPNIITVHDITLDLALVTDSLWYPFDELAEAFVIGTNYDTVEWYVDHEFMGTGDDITFEASTDQPTDEVLVTAIAKNEYCDIQVSKIIKLTNYEDFNMPNAFTPNGDGLNDIFIPVGRQVDNAEYFMFKIHNRWGEQLFITNEKTEGWDGLDKEGKPVSSGVYVWNLELQSELSGRQSYEGWVKLIK